MICAGVRGLVWTCVVAGLPSAVRIVDCTGHECQRVDCVCPQRQHTLTVNREYR
eukprot:COSAG02_NODE_64_length_43111_cov_35.627709_39_plen_54_part_00